MGKLPAFQFYPRDWMADPELSRCSLAARGVWMDVLCILWECVPRGVLQTNGKPWRKEDLALTVRGDVQQVARCIDELVAKNVLRVTSTGTYFSQRLVRDEKERKQWRIRQMRKRHADVTPMSRRSSSSSSSSIHTRSTNFSQDSVSREPVEGKQKSGWVDRDEERRKKNKAAIDASFSKRVGRDAGGDVPKKKPD